MASDTSDKWYPMTMKNIRRAIKMTVAGTNVEVVRD
jgi:hypothetical protein